MRSFAPTDLEQLTLELINRARTDPQGEVDAVLADIPPLRPVAFRMRSIFSMWIWGCFASN